MPPPTTRTQKDSTAFHNILPCIILPSAPPPPHPLPHHHILWSPLLEYRQNRVHVLCYNRLFTVRQCVLTLAIRSLNFLWIASSLQCSLFKNTSLVIFISAASKALFLHSYIFHNIQTSPRRFWNDRFQILPFVTDHFGELQYRYGLDEFSPNSSPQAPKVTM